MDEIKYLTIVIQGGSFALLAAIAAWLMRWVPQRFARHDEAAEKEQAARLGIATAHQSAVETVTSAFRAEIREERDVCERRHQDVLARCVEASNGIRTVREDIRDLAGTLHVEDAVRRDRERRDQKTT